jgi:hypothetical protein
VSFILVRIEGQQAHNSLAKTAMLKVLSKKASRMKVVMDRLKVDLSQRKCRERAEELSGVVTQGMEAVQGAKY